MRLSFVEKLTDSEPSRNVPFLPISNARTQTFRRWRPIGLRTFGNDFAFGAVGRLYPSFVRRGSAYVLMLFGRQESPLLGCVLMSLTDRLLIHSPRTSAVSFCALSSS